MRALFDINMLITLLDQDHVFHHRARNWWTANRQHGWASCPLSQNGFVRIVTQRTYLSPRPIGDAMAILRRAVSRPDHEFWSDDFTLLDDKLVDHSRLLGPSQITDTYLLALAVKHGGRLVTFDRRISTNAIRSAGPEHLAFIG